MDLIRGKQNLIEHKRKHPNWKKNLTVEPNHRFMTLLKLFIEARKLLAAIVVIWDSCTKQGIGTLTVKCPLIIIQHNCCKDGILTFKVYRSTQLSKEGIIVLISSVHPQVKQWRKSTSHVAVKLEKSSAS